MRQTLYLTAVLGAVWLLNSGHYTPLMLFFGAISIVFVLWLSRRMDVVDYETTPFYLTPRLPMYYWWLFRKIITSNIDVAIRVWKGPRAISPQLARIPLTQSTDMGKVIYANSITLTPGTLVVNLDEDSVLVHSLTKEGIEELHEGEMDRRVKRLEEEC